MREDGEETGEPETVRGTVAENVKDRVASEALGEAILIRLSWPLCAPVCPRCRLRHLWLGNNEGQLSFSVQKYRKLARVNL